MHGLVGRDGPEGVEVDIDGQEPEDEGQRRQFGFETDGHQDNESSPNHVLQDLCNKEHGEVGIGRFAEDLSKFQGCPLRRT